MVPVEFTDSPAIIDDFAVVTSRSLPKVVLGFEIRHRYDQLTSQITERYHPINIIHVNHHDEATLIHGIEIEPKPEIVPLIKQLSGFKCKTARFSLYNHMIQEFFLSCSDNFKLFKDGIYPLNTECLHSVTNTDMTSEYIYSNFFDKNCGAAWQRTKYLSIFILTDTGSNTDEARKAFAEKNLLKLI